MLSPLIPYSLFKMHWSPEHGAPLSQWPEQHLDVSSSTSPSSGHKPDPYGPAARPGYGPGYTWASDDISALTASSLLKRYADKYSGLDLPYERPLSAAYQEPGTFLKSEPESWALGPGLDGYPGLEGLASGPKGGSSSVGLPGTGSVTVVGGNMTPELGYGGGSSCSGPPSQDYPPAYNSTYFPSGYCPQPGSLQPATTLVPSYSPAGPVYNYTPGCYPHQASLTSGYTHPTASYLPSGISAPTPLPPRPTTVGGSYGYPGHSLGEGPEVGGGSLKRKAFEMAEEEEGADADAPRYRKYDNGHRNGQSKDQGDNNGFHPDRQLYKSSKQPSHPGGLGEVAKYSMVKPLVSPPYGGPGDYSPSSGLNGDAGGREHSFPYRQRLSMKQPELRAPSEEPPTGC